ncbi:MAG: hypothetical protein M1438_09295 [Deltaproteobacteria bacterium]|nr:hypothetical protein [Deltaproteobacteria bacterium]
MLPALTNAEFLALREDERQRLCKQLTFDLIHEGPLSPKELADKLGWTYRYLLKHGEEAEPGKKLFCRRLLEAIHYQKAQWALEWLCGLSGLLVFRKPQALACLPDLNRQISAVLKETAAAVEAVIGAVDPASPGGPAITRQEKEEISKEIAEAIGHLAAMEKAVLNYYAGQRRHPHNPMQAVER